MKSNCILLCHKFLFIGNMCFCQLLSKRDCYYFVLYSLSCPTVCILCSLFPSKSLNVLHIFKSYTNVVSMLDLLILSSHFQNCFFKELNIPLYEVVNTICYARIKKTSLFLLNSIQTLQLKVIIERKENFNIK